MKLGLSECRLCRLTGLNRSTKRYSSIKQPEDEIIAQRMIADPNTRLSMDFVADRTIKKS